jgi:hypothetical protein
MPIQEVIEDTEWVSQSGNPVAYAPHIRKTPLAGVSAKSVIYQFARGDQIVPNPATTALLRAGDLADRATFYRHDLAFAENPQLPTNPHGFLAALDIPGFRAITRGAQEQIATFFATDGAAVIHPEPARFFETPISLPLPEGLNYILPPGPGGATAPIVSSLSVAGTPAAAALSGAGLADMGTSAAREHWPSAAALLTAWSGRPLLRPSIARAPSERPAPSPLNIAWVNLFVAVTDAEDPGFGWPNQERPRRADDSWLDLMPANRSWSPSDGEVLGSDW